MDDEKSRVRRQIIDVATDILERDGVHAVSTRSVAAAAGVRAASLYQLFGDKDGLLTALAVHAFEVYLAEKNTLIRSDDPVEDLRRGWDVHVDFGLRHPAFYLLMFGTDSPARRPPAFDEAHRLLLTFLDHVAAAGRLRVPPAAAAHLFQAAATGITLSLISTPAADRDPQLSTRMRESLVDSLITTTATRPADTPGLASWALALDATLGTAEVDALPLRTTEVALLRDWLARLAR
ncbi:TetR/AcrR family transcriptional regulator [Umezawaea beigongshangensis]|uniref:TetR/AcrR family transcriptional regulator n=1 Tax=Umezawaea beigongshangensis TaxID=2780383 RepID=UPI0018F12625|nr:TetR/AcrR family transcriptional regulator [Umezawaea beigongshangensis]